MPSFTKFDSMTGSNVRSWNCPRPVGPSQRAVMMPFTSPIAIMAPWPLRTCSESTAKCRRLGRSAMRIRLHRRERVQRIAARAQDRLPGAGQIGAPERGDLRLERVTGRLEPGLVDRHVGGA